MFKSEAFDNSWLDCVMFCEWLSDYLTLQVHKDIVGVRNKIIAHKPYKNFIEPLMYPVVIKMKYEGLVKSKKNSNDLL